MTWKERLIGIPLAVLGAVLLAATAAGMTLTRTGWGREQVRAFALEKLNAAISGRITVEAVLEGDLFRTVRMAGVRIYEPDGREFARVDTVTVRYRWADFLIGNVTIQEVELAGPVARVRSLPGGGFNFEEIFRGRKVSQGDEKEGRGRRIVLREVTIRYGDVSLFLPSDPDDPRLSDSRWHVVEHEGTRGRLFRLERLSAQLPIARVAAPAGAGRLFRIAQLTGRATVIGEPFDVEQLRADLELHGDTLAFVLWEGDLSASHLFGEGQVTLSGDTEYDVTLSGNPFTTQDVNWLLPWLPPGVAYLDLHFQSVPGGIALKGSNARWVSPDARLSGRFGLRFDDGPGGVEFDDLALDIERVTSGLIASLSGWQPPTAGEVSGRVELDGRPRALRVDADLQLLPAASPEVSRLQARGVALAMPGSLGAEDLNVAFDTLQLDLLRAFVPGLAVTGELSGTARLDGTLVDGLDVRFEVEQRDQNLVPTRLGGGGRVWADGLAPPRLDLTLEARQVSLTTLANYYPAIPFRGEFAGGVRAVGPLNNLRVEGRLAGAGDSLRLGGTLRVAKGEIPGYEAEIRGWRVRLPRFRPALPQSDLDFTVQIEGRGVRPAEAESSGRAQLFASFVGGVQFDSARADFRLSGGRLQVDSAVAAGEFGELRVDGALPLVAGRSDSLRFELRADSLGAFNAWLAPGYAPLARQRLVANGDGAEAEDDVGARLEGLASARGWAIQEAGGLELRGSLAAQRLVYGGWSADSLRVDSLSVGRQNQSLTARASVAGKGVGIGELRFTDLQVTGQLMDSLTDLSFELAKPGAAARGHMWIGSAGRAHTVGLDSFNLLLGGSDWELVEPAQLDLEESGAVAVRGFELRSGSRRMELEGSVGVAGPAAFTARITGVDLAELASLWPDSLAVGGRLELNAELSGLVRDPVVTGRFEVVDGHIFGVSYTNFAGTLDYGGGQLALDASMWAGDDPLFRVYGALPFDLTLPDFGLAIPERPIELRLDGDSVPLALVTVFTDQIENVRGHARAALVMRGTPRNVDMQGPVGLRDGGFRFVWSGIDYGRLEGQLLFDGAVMRAKDVALRGTQGGRGTISGTVDFSELGNPRFALQLDAVELPAYDQIDARVVGSGRIELSGRYDLPEISGNLSVVHGVLYLEELERRTAIVDPFEDPRLLIDPGFLEETTGGRRSPFMENLTIQLGLKVERDTWLRSSEANVEITGNLNVQMQPAQKELWIDGTLEAVRGDYRYVNKRFEVIDGTIEFVGTPAMNPNLRITARYTVRTKKEPIDIRLLIGGTLEDMTLTLESDAQPPIPESDLLSYLVFGRPSYELTRPGDEGSLLGDFTRGVPEALVGYALGSLLVGESGIAYVDVSRVDPVGEEGEFRQPLGPALSATQVELGWYLAPTVFVSFAQQLVGVPPTARVEWRLDERFTLRAITQPRFGRQSALFFEATSAELQQSFGLFLFYGWAY